MQKKLFSEFTPSTAADWKNQLLKELKGEDYESLRWPNENGFVVEPFYTAGDLSVTYAPAFTHHDWNIGIDTRPLQGNKNKHLLQSLREGANAFHHRLADNHSLEILLEGVQLNAVHSTFTLRNTGDAEGLARYIEKNHNPAELQWAVVNPGCKASEYNLWLDKLSSLEVFASAKKMEVDVTPWYHLNCFAYYELALALAGLVDNIEACCEKSMPGEDIVVRMGVGTDYFISIAKLRALRRLWKLIGNRYGMSSNLYVIAESSLNNKSLGDRHNNLLRTTVEGMAAVAGGCNELLLTGFDQLFPQQSEMTTRLAINQQHILKYESYLDKVADVACGSYYIESLTDQLAQKALDAFKLIEKHGGYSKFDCRPEVLKQARQKLVAFEQGKTIITGINKFRNEKEELTLSTNHADFLDSLSHPETGDVVNPGLLYELKHYVKNHA